ncbi:MAG: hypothetical protein KY469_01120 [Actinobacteria bacterium]|nr:hypothetical protein [Actinomycetota bacterium]
MTVRTGPVARTARVPQGLTARSRSRRGPYATDELLRLQRSAGNRVVVALLGRADAPAGTHTGSSRIQRRELRDNPRVSRVLLPQHWERSDRISWTQRWKSACQHNLLHVRRGEYTTIEQRRDFYRWFYEATAARGYHTRWALAAYIVASGMAEMASVDLTEGISPITNELQGLARIGNQVIFDDVLPKLKRLWVNGPLTGAAALQADAEILAEEQTLIQTMYDDLSPDTMRRFQRIANNRYTRTQLGRGLGLGGHVSSGRHRRGGGVPTFSSVTGNGDINRPEDRWSYGMELGARFSTLPAYGSMRSMPAVGSDYRSGAAFRRLNVRPNLHMLDARLNDTDVPEGEVVQLLKNLNETVEQPELMSNRWRIRNLADALNASEMREGIEKLRRVPVRDRLFLMGGSVGYDWSELDYSDVQSIITNAAPNDRRQLHVTYWKNRFIQICDDDTIVDATRDLGLPPATARAWIRAERSWL